MFSIFLKPTINCKSLIQLRDNGIANKTGSRVTQVSDKV